jgi:hypothetical protein
MRVLGLIAGLLALVLVATGVWWLLNAGATMRLPADQAAITVAKRYGARTTGTFAARFVESATSHARTTAVFVVSRDGRDIARVVLQPFLKRGWQEVSYQRMEPGSQGTN